MIKKLINHFSDFLPGKKILKNIGYLLAGEIFSKILMFFITIYLARSLNPEFYGRYSIAFHFAMGFLFLVDFGMNTILLRDGSKDHSKLGNLINKVFTFKLYSGFLTILLINTISIFFLPYDYNQKILIALASILVLFKELINVVNMTFRAVEHMNYNSIVRIGEVVLFSLIVIFALMVSITPLSVLLSWMASMLIILIIQYILSRRFIDRYLSLVLDWPFCWRIIKQSFWIGIAMFLSSFYSTINIFIISILIGASSVAFYTVAVQLVSAGTLIRNVISDAVFPNTCKRINDKGYAQKLLKYITIVSILSAFGSLIITLFAKFIVKIAFGVEYLASIPVLQILTWYVPIFIYNIWACQVMDSTNNQKYHVYNEIFIVLTTVFLSYFLISHYGVVGAAIASITARFVGTLFLNFFAWKILNKMKVVA